MWRSRDPLGDELTRLFPQHHLTTGSTTVVLGEYLDVPARVA